MDDIKVQVPQSGPEVNSHAPPTVAEAEMEIQPAATNHLLTEPEINIPPPPPDPEVKVEPEPTNIEDVTKFDDVTTGDDTMRFDDIDIKYADDDDDDDNLSTRL